MENAFGETCPHDGLFHLRADKTQILVYHPKKFFAYCGMKFVIALFDPPYFSTARRALHSNEAALAGGREIVHLFLYQNGVHNASASAMGDQDEFDLPTAWRELVERNGLDTVVCIAVVLRHGVLNVEEAERYGRPGASPDVPWELSGFGQLHKAT